jgi:hypothetical protein
VSAAAAEVWAAALLAVARATPMAAMVKVRRSAVCAVCLEDWIGIGILLYLGSSSPGLSNIMLNLGNLELTSL